MMKNFLLLILCLSFIFPVWARSKKKVWNEVKGKHFIVYYKNAPRDFAVSIEQAAEEYYHKIARNLGFRMYRTWRWEDRPSIYIYDSAEDYQESAQIPWSHGIANIDDKRIETYPMAHGFFDSTLPHELGHIIFREFIGLEADIPLWFEEGVAMYQERAKRWGAHQDVLKAIDEDKFVPLQDLESETLTKGSDVEFVRLFYAESASVVYYMMTELGSQRFVRLCRALEDGMSFEKALKKAYVRFKKIKDLNRAWMNYLESQK